MKTKLLDLLLFSEKRKNLLILLRDGTHTLADIRQSLDVTSSGVIPQIRMLEQRNLVEQNNQGYALTDIGRLLSDFLYPLVRVVDIIEKNEDYWHRHDFSSIPDFLQKRLYELEDSEVDEVDLQNMYEPHRLFFESLNRSKWVKGITSVFNPSYPELFLNLIRSGKKIQLILTPEVFKRSSEEFGQHSKEFYSLGGEIYIYNGQLRLASVITDNYFSMTPFFKDGGYDSQRNLACTSASAILWGIELFEYLLKGCSKV